MLTYRAPTRDISFILTKVLNASGCLGRDGLSDDLIEGVVSEIGRLCENELTPINRDGDEIGCELIDGVVRTPPGFKDAFRSFANGGWIGMCLDAEDGGQGLPEVLNVALHEMIMSACLSFGDYIGLPQAAAKTLAHHASGELRGLYVPNLATGRWGATMCMTEPSCGTDLGLIATSAKQLSDGRYTVNGTKIFISGGDQDITENIVHLVLARLEGAPAGIKGLSLFVCPKFVPNESGGIGDRNAVRPVRLEKKMGYHGISTCEMVFDGAAAWLVGEPNRGLAAMFTMVNTARLLVALQGLGAAEAAYQNAAHYARERLQGRSLNGPLFASQKADPLIVHPDVRRILLGARAFVEGGRALALWLGLQIDLSESGQTDEARTAASDFAALLTPVVKSMFSDLGFETCNSCMQVWGGHGYIRDNGMEQLVRDCRIAQIQEGANGIQALDLLGRKITAENGRAWGAFKNLVRSDLDASAHLDEIKEWSARLLCALESVDVATRDILQRAQHDRNELGSAGVDYLRAFGLVALGWMWVRIVSAALAGDDKARRSEKLAVARFFFARELPKVEGHLVVAQSGADVLMALPSEMV